MGIITTQSHDIVVIRIQEILQEMRPTIAAHGGDIQLVSYNDGVVGVALSGACVGCPMSIFTLKMGIEERLKDALPEISEVIAITV